MLTQKETAWFFKLKVKDANEMNTLMKEMNMKNLQKESKLMLHNSEKDFIKRHIGLKKQMKNMLSELGYKSLNDLIKAIQFLNKILLKDLLSIGEPNSEYEALRKLKAISKKIKFTQILLEWDITEHIPQM